jgi:predicted nucleic acid-binding protein
MNLFADSSALAKRYIADERSEQVDALLYDATNLTVSVLCLPEIISALCSRRRERSLTLKQYSTAKEALEADLVDATVIQMTDEVILKSVDIWRRIHFVLQTLSRLPARSRGAPTHSFRLTPGSVQPQKLQAGFFWCLNFRLHPCSIFAQASRSVTVRLNTNRSLVESGSTQK